MKRFFFSSIRRENITKIWGFGYRQEREKERERDDTVFGFWTQIKKKFLFIVFVFRFFLQLNLLSVDILSQWFLCNNSAFAIIPKIKSENIIQFHQQFHIGNWSATGINFVYFTSLFVSIKYSLTHFIFKLIQAFSFHFHRKILMFYGIYRVKDTHFTGMNATERKKNNSVFIHDEKFFVFLWWTKWF